jgi:asparagine N-glycosylation enzyme membrane subunit Stt3
MDKQKYDSKLELSKTLSRNHEIVILVILFLTAFVVRMITYDSIFVGDKIRFLEFDPFYHMRRVVSFAENFPHIWNFDTYLNFPYGNVVGWPPLFDWTIALIANIIGLGSPNRHLIETVGVYFPVFIGSLSVIVVYFIAKEIFNDWDNIQVNNGEYVKKSKKSKKGNEKDKGKLKVRNWKYVKSWQIGLISGLILAIIPAFVQVSFLGFVDHHVAEVLLSSTAFLFLIKTLKAENTRNMYISLTMMVVILILAMFTWSGTPIFVGIIAIYGMIQCAVEKRYKYLFVIIGTLLVCYVGIYFISPDTYNLLNSGVGFLIKNRIELQQIQETQPLFFTFDGKFNIDHSWYSFNTTFYIAMISIIIFGINIIRNNSSNNISSKKIIGLNHLISNRVKIFFFVWTLIVLTMNLYQTRFVYLFAVNVGILCAYLIVELIYSNKIYTEILGLIFIVIILVPSIQMDNTMREHPLMFSNDWFVACEWLKDNTPDTNSSWSMPSDFQIPSYGIMSWWDYGNYILYLSERPVVANNFQLGAEDSAKFYTSENETDANKIMNGRKARYVIVDYRMGLNIFKEGSRTYVRGSWVALAFLSGKNISYYLDNRNVPNDKYLNTMYAKLYLFDGKGMEDKYKLVYTSKTLYSNLFGKPIGEIKIFEYMG